MEALRAMNRAEIKAQLKQDRIELLDAAKRAAAACGAADREVLRVLAACDRAELWREEACRSTAEWTARHFHISSWKAARWINAAHALEKLPFISACLENGSLSLDKTIELTRFATSETETKLASWARRTTPGGIRRRADEAVRIPLEKVQDAFEARAYESWLDPQNNCLRFQGSLPADGGACLNRAIERLALGYPKTSAGEPSVTMEQKRADALVELASAFIAADKDPDRATVMVHVDLETLTTGAGNAELAGSLPIHPDMARRLCCGSRLQLVVEGKDGPMGAGDVVDAIPPSLRRQVLRRDRHCCSFPGCSRKVRLVPHHIHHDALGGPADLFNLTSLCGLHHWYMHEGRWSVTRMPDGDLIFFTPAGRRYDPGPAPPDRDSIPPSAQPTKRSLIEARCYLGSLALI